MLKILLGLIGLVVAAIAGLLAYATTKPDDFRVTRSIVVKAPPEKIFPLVNDLHAWNAWSPYEKKDPAMKRSFAGAPSGKGAIYEWDGDGNVGKGRMEIIDAPAPAKVVIKLDFFKPFEGHNVADFTFTPQADGTRVAWGMYGPSPYIAKVMGTILNMDKMIGDDFEAGLRNLKALAEK